MSDAQQEIDAGQRFPFGKNWSAFLSTLNPERVGHARRSLQKLLGMESLAGKTFLDAGSGSGLFSLAARELGATVTSFDFDQQSVACARELKQRYFSEDPGWTISQGSILDDEFVQGLGTFDIVYSWGVLHHTGNMWQALENAAALVKPGGQLAIALYNDQGPISRGWLKVKQLYCGNVLGKLLVSALFVPYFWLRTVAVSLIRGENVFRTYRRERGMSIWHDWHDWLGGLPFEVAKVEDVLHFGRKRGLILTELVTTNGLGCNQMVFQKFIENELAN